ncbi:hypothetical protein [Pedobacter sp. MW01-1-1]|uniref:hypothetical protein n=1 Tax=Pedobacter sp. MW01-1-1 TaxID=3383027 RepID=UPI003FEE5344
MIKESHETEYTKIASISEKMSLCIVYFVVGRTLEDNVLQKCSEVLYHEITDEIQLLTVRSNLSILLRFGWLTEFLIEHDVLRLNSHDFLSDLDDQIYLQVIYSMDTLPNRNALEVNMALYFYKRISNKKKHNNFYRSICNIECLCLLLIRISDKLNALNYTVNEYYTSSIFQLIYSLFLKVKPTRICYETVNCTLNKLGDLDLTFPPLPTRDPINYKQIKLPIIKSNKNVQIPKEDDLYNLLISIDSEDRLGWKEGWQHDKI